VADGQLERTEDPTKLVWPGSPHQTGSPEALLGENHSTSSVPSASKSPAAGRYDLVTVRPTLWKAPRTVEVYQTESAPEPGAYQKTSSVP